MFLFNLFYKRFYFKLFCNSIFLKAHCYNLLFRMRLLFVCLFFFYCYFILHKFRGEIALKGTFRDSQHSSHVCTEKLWRSSLTKTTISVVWETKCHSLNWKHSFGRCHLINNPEHKYVQFTIMLRQTKAKKKNNNIEHQLRLSTV